MGAEIFDVEISIDEQIITYATKCDFKRNKDTNTTLTFNGDVTTGAGNSGATISFEGLVFPTDVDDAIALENKITDDNIKSITCTGKSYTAAGVPYRRTIIGTNVTVSTDDESWSPSDGITHSFEVSVDRLEKFSEPF